MRSPGNHEWQLYRRLLREIKPYKWQLTGIFFLSLLSAPLTLLTPLPLKIVIDSVIGSAPLPHWLNALVPEPMAQSDATLLILAILMLIAIEALQHAAGYINWIAQLYTGERLVLNLRQRLFLHAQRLSIVYHDRMGITDSLYRIQYDTIAIRELLVQGLPPAATSLLTILAMIYITARINPTLAWIAVAIVPVLLALIEFYRRRIRIGWTQVKEVESAAMAVMQEALAANRVVKAFGQEWRETLRFSQYADRGFRMQVRVVLLESLFGILQAMTITCRKAAVLYFRVRDVQQQALSVGDLLVVMAYLTMLYKPLEKLSKNVTSLQSSLASAERAYRLLDEPTDVPERKHPVMIDRARGELRFEHVHFTYETGREVLRNVNFHIHPGMTVGIAGPTGSGKTTIASLIFRFLDPTAGRILLDGQDLRDYHLASLRNQFGIMLQEPILLPGTIAQNIAYAYPHADRQSIVAAAQAANSHDFIRALPDGYETLVGERGMRLSGGERQRIALARAFLTNAPILVLDEPTSEIDVKSEAPIIDALHHLIHSRTCIMIAHRLSTLQRCDMRLELNAKGQVTVSLQTKPSP